MIDTLQLTKDLEAAGKPREEAERTARALAEAQKDVVTSHELKAAINEAKFQIVFWIVGSFVAQALLILWKHG
jgi:hypothetical protein